MLTMLRNRHAQRAPAKVTMKQLLLTQSFCLRKEWAEKENRTYSSMRANEKHWMLSYGLYEASEQRRAHPGGLTYNHPAETGELSGYTVAWEAIEVVK